MTTELEKQFFYTFDIKPIRYNSSLEDWEFPPITDRILLELICVISDINPITIHGIKKVELLKNPILLTCIGHKEICKQNVRALFKE